MSLGVLGTSVYETSAVFYVSEEASRVEALKVDFWISSDFLSINKSLPSQCNAFRELFDKVVAMEICIS